MNFEKIQLKVDEKYSFVGIKSEKGNLFLYLPKGFSSQVSSSVSFNSKRDLFFLLYRVLSEFKDMCVEKNLIKEDYRLLTQDRDGVFSSPKGAYVSSRDQSETILYSSIDSISNLIDNYDEQKILALSYRSKKTENFDLSNIHKYLHQAVYLPDHTAYVDQAMLPRPTMHFESGDVVLMYCYIFCEVKKIINDTVNPRIIALSERFVQQYIGPHDSIFDASSYHATVAVLKDVLDFIDKHTPIKDSDYWKYYDSIENFLYGNWESGEDGVIWGISNFHSVWESMCLTYVAQTMPSCIMHIDSRYVKNSLVNSIETNSSSIYLTPKSFKCNDVTLVPDAVLMNSLFHQVSPEGTNNAYLIVPPSDTWNDYGYRTSIYARRIGSRLRHSISLSVGCVNQKELCTFDELAKIYKCDEYERVICDKPLPNNFYSFWTVPEEIDFRHLHAMSYFNHFFYVALEKGITTWIEFKAKILMPLGIDFPVRKSQENVFSLSLLRNYCMEVNGTLYDKIPKESAIRKDFERFVQSFCSKYEESIEIVDAKYLSESFFSNPKNKKRIKNRSVRKQFVYEHLLQKHLVNTKSKFRKTNIFSSFWIPDYQPENPNELKSEQVFLDGYIQLNKMNFANLAKHYTG